MKQEALKRLLKHTDLLAAVAVVVVITMLVIPLPSLLLDLFITVNISAALAVVVATMYLQKPLDFSAATSVRCERCSIEVMQNFPSIIQEYFAGQRQFHCSCFPSEKLDP